MRRTTPLRHITLAAAVAALFLITGCGDDDGGGLPPGTPVPTNTAGPTATATPIPVAGEYTGSVLVDGEPADVEISVATDGSATGTVVLEDPTAGGGGGGAAAIISVGVLGTVNTVTGAYDLGGTFPGAGGTVTVRLTGVLPGPGRAGTMTLEVNGVNYTGQLSPVVPPTSTPGPVSTATPTSAQVNPTFTATPGNTGGVSADMLRTWSGTARNDTTGVRIDARIRIAVEGGRVVAIDLNRNVFQGSDRLTMEVRSPNNVTYNAFGPPVVTLTFSLTSPTTLVGLYGVTTTTFPPQTTSLALDLRPEG